MEITLNIPTNDYQQPKEVRQEVVQAICDAFLARHCSNIFHPGSDGRYRYPTLYVFPGDGRRAASFHDADWARNHEGFIRFNGEEMKAAFAALRKAGYHMFKRYEYGSWMGYICEKKPHVEGCTEVREFTEFID